MKLSATNLLKSVFLLLCTGMMLWPLLSAAAQEQYVIRLATYKFEQTWHGKLREEFIRSLEEASDHRLKVEICEQSDHHNYPDFAAQIETGDMDIALLSNEGLYSYSTKFQALYAPYLFENYQLAHDVLDHYILNWVNEELMMHNICVFAFIDFGYRQYTTRNVVVRAPKDLANVKMAVAPLPGMNETTQALGAHPVNIEFTQLYDSLKERKVVGQENTLSIINALKLYEVQNKLILSNHVFMTLPLLVNIKFFNALPSDLQQILREQIDVLQAKSREAVVEAENAILKDLVAHGMEVIHPEISLFVEQVDSAYQAIAQNVGEREMLTLLFEISRARYDLQQARQDAQGSSEEDDEDDED